MQMRRRKPNDPMLMGQPSPGLTRINKMNMAKLAEQIERLKLEKQRLGEKIKRLEAVTPKPAERIATLDSQMRRLGVLEKTARERLVSKEERKERWDERHSGGDR
ncbi:MAG: hypothetical protein WD042_06845 [Phycisphaeraceae bacterium]